MLKRPVRLCFVGSGRLFELGVCEWVPHLLSLLPQGSLVKIVFWRGHALKAWWWRLRWWLSGKNAGITVIQTVNSDAFRRWLCRHQIQTVFVAALGEKVDNDTLNHKRRHWLNAHPSLLPLYRGGNPYSAAIRDSCSCTGITLHEMTSEWDHGPLWAQYAIPLPTIQQMTAGDVQEVCARALPKLWEQALRILDGQYPEFKPALPKRLPKTHHAFWAPSLRVNDRLLNPSIETAEGLERRLRAIRPWATGCLFLGEFSLDTHWLLVKEAHLDPKRPYRFAVSCADGRTFYVARGRKVVLRNSVLQDH